MAVRQNAANQSRTLPAAILLWAILGLSAAAIGQSITDYAQQVVRLNPKRDPGKPPYTVAECFANEHCLSFLTQSLVQAGGNAGLLADARQEPQPEVSGDQSVYRFEAPEGESFCKAVLLKISLAPNFGGSAPELKFSASKKTVLATVRLPAGEGAPPRAWFDGILILLSVKDVTFAESSCSLKEVTQEAACKGNCETVRF